MPTETINGADLYYEERGAGPPILFIHGTGTYRVIFQEAIQALPETLRTIAYDRRGFGDSRGSLAARLDDHVADAAELLRRLDAAPATVVAISGAGPIALELTAVHPDLVSALVLAEPAFQLALAPSLSTARAMTALGYRRWLRRRPEAAALGFYRWASAYQAGSNAFDSYPEEWGRVAARHADATLREMTQLIRPRPSARAVRAISCPVTLVLGDIGEPVFRRTTRRVQRLLPDARIVNIRDAAHIIPTDQPQAFAAAVADGAQT